MQPVGRGPQVDKPVGILAGLHNQPRDTPQHAGDQRADPAVTAMAAGGDATIHQQHGDATAFGRPQKVGPQLEFDQHDPRGTQPVKRRADRPAEIEGPVHHAGVGESLPGQFVTSRGRGRNDDFKVTPGAGQFGNQPGQLQHLTHADSMEPQGGHRCGAGGDQPEQFLPPVAKPLAPDK